MLNIGQRRRGWVDDEDDAPRRLPLFERRRPVNGVLVRYFRFSHCAAFIISSNLIRTLTRFINSSNFYARFLFFFEKRLYWQRFRKKREKKKKKRVTPFPFSIKFAKTNQKFAENFEFCENYSLLFKIIHWCP